MIALDILGGECQEALQYGTQSRRRDGRPIL